MLYAARMGVRQCVVVIKGEREMKGVVCVCVRVCVCVCRSGNESERVRARG